MEVKCEQSGFIWLTDALQLLYPLSSFLSHLLSFRALWAPAKQLIPLTFTLLFQPSSDASLAAFSCSAHNVLRWTNERVDDAEWTMDSWSPTETQNQHVIL